MVRGVRGAVQAEGNSKALILDASERLMQALIMANEIAPEKVTSVFFTVTEDLDAEFPAAIRDRIGWRLVPFLCGKEISVPGALQRVIRVLILFETERSQEEMKHQYLGAASALRPDLET